MDPLFFVKRPSGSAHKTLPFFYQALIFQQWIKRLLMTVTYVPGQVPAGSIAAQGKQIFQRRPAGFAGKDVENDVIHIPHPPRGLSGAPGRIAGGLRDEFDCGPGGDSIFAVQTVSRGPYGGNGAALAAYLSA